MLLCLNGIAPAAEVEGRMSIALSAKLRIELQVINVLSGHLPPDCRKIDSGSRLVEDLHMDSMSLIEIVMGLNQTFGIQLPESEVGEWRSVADICSSVMLSRDIAIDII